MKASNYFGIAIIVFAVFASGATADELPTQHRQPIELQLQVGRQEHGVVLLEIALSYVSAEPMTIYESSLPWRMQRSLLLSAICMNAKRLPLYELQQLENPTPTTVQLKEGSQLRGSIDLSDRFPKLRKCLAGHDAILFWSYRPKAIDAEPGTRIGGFIEISHD